MKTLEAGRISIGAFALGIAQGAMEASVEYAKERKQFDKPIAQFQAIQEMLANMATEIHAARLMVHDAARRKDAGEEFSMYSSMCKLFASEMAMRVTDDAIQIHGGYGLSEEYEVGRLVLEAKALELGEGTSELHRKLIAEFALGMRRQ